DGLRQQSRKQMEIIGDDYFRHDFCSGGRGISEYASPCVQIFFQSLHAQCGLPRESVSDIQAVSHEHLCKTGCASVPEPHVFKWHGEPAFVPRGQDMIPAGQRLNTRVHIAEFSQWIFGVPGRKDLVDWDLNLEVRATRFVIIEFAHAWRGVSFQPDLMTDLARVE